MPVPDRSSLVDASDAILAGRAADGDVAAFEVLLRRHAPLLRATARRVLGSDDEVDDVVQETFIVAWQQLPSLADHGALRGWLMRVLQRRCIDRLRARRAHVDLADVEVPASDDATPARIAEARSRAHAVELVLAGLPEAQRRCWVMKEIVGSSYEEIADDLGLPVSTVRGLLSRARKNMVRGMEGWR